MSLLSSSKLHSAVNDVIGRAAERMSAIVRECPQMSAPGKNCETNPIPLRPLAPRQLRAIELILAGRSLRAAARELGLNEKTLRRWNIDPRFAAELKRRLEALKCPRLSANVRAAGSLQNEPNWRRHG